MTREIFDGVSYWLSFEGDIPTLREGLTDLPEEFRMMFLQIAKDNNRGEVRLVGWAQTTVPDRDDNDVFIEIEYMDCEFDKTCGCERALQNTREEVQYAKEEGDLKYLAYVENELAVLKTCEVHHAPFRAGYGCNSLTGKVVCYVS